MALYNLAKPIDRKRYIAKAKRLMEKALNGASVYIEFTEKNKPKTVKQNAYMHVCICLFAIEFGWTKSEAKTHLKRKCPYEFTKYQEKGEWFLQSTAKYDKEQSAMFIDWLREYSAKHGCYLPTSQEYLEDKYEYERTIQQQQKHL